MTEDQENIMNSTTGEDYKDKYLRALADYANLKQRTDKEILRARETGKIDLINALLPAVDTLNSAVAHSDNSDAVTFKNGIELFTMQLLDILNKAGLEEVSPAGQVFSPELHNCVQTVSGSTESKGLIAKVCTVGYSYKGVIIRYPRVAVYE